MLPRPALGREVERVLELEVTAAGRRVGEPCQGRLTQILRDADPESGALLLQRLPEVGAEANGGLMHAAGRHIERVSPRYACACRCKPSKLRRRSPTLWES